MAIPAVISRITRKNTCPFGSNVNSDGGKNEPAWNPAVDGAPTPSYGFHQGAWPLNQSSMARWLKACPPNPMFGSMNGYPGSGAGVVWVETLPTIWMGLGSSHPKSTGAWRRRQQRR